MNPGQGEEKKKHLTSDITPCGQFNGAERPSRVARTYLVSATFISCGVHQKGDRHYESTGSSTNDSNQMTKEKVSNEFIDK
jgi:hypothetical protein